MTDPQFIMLIGAPGSGKSTWTENFLKTAAGDWVVISSDAFIDIYADEHGLTYSEAYDKVNYNDVAKMVNAKAALAFENNINVIWDQTNMNVKTRSKKLKKAPNNYELNAIVFILDRAVLQERLDVREEQIGKRIPPHIVTSMLDSYEPPTNKEGFMNIQIIND